MIEFDDDRRHVVTSRAIAAGVRRQTMHKQLKNSKPIESVRSFFDSLLRRFDGEVSSPDDRERNRPHLD